MNLARMMRNGAIALSITFGAAALSSCTDYGGGYYGGGPAVDVGVGFDYYDSPGYYGGGWGHGYRVGPGRGDHWDHHDDHGHGGGNHSYRSAPSGRSAPSIPSRGHGGGGGGHGGGPHH